MAGEERQDRARRGYWPVLRALRLVLQQFPANTPQQETAPIKDSSPYIVENKESAKKAPAKIQCSLQRIKAACRTIAKRKASNRRVRELWYAGCVR